MVITVFSGKGGVGKSMLSSALAVLFSKKMDVVAIDCDTDAPNLALWLGIDTNTIDSKNTRDISTIEKPVIDHDKCIFCKQCISQCPSDALVEKDGKVGLIKYRCEGCGLCEIICKQKAIKLEPVMNCKLSIFNSKWKFPVVQGQIKPGEAESGKAVAEIKKLANKYVEKDTVIIQDSAAGIGCPVIASIRGSDLLVGVCEPSKSSMHDLDRAIKLAQKFNIDYRVVINKYDLNIDISEKIANIYKNKVIGKISYDQKVIDSISSLTPILDSESKVKDEIKDIYNHLLKHKELSKVN